MKNKAKTINLKATVYNHKNNSKKNRYFNIFPCKYCTTHLFCNGQNLILYVLLHLKD